ncbi:MAG: N-acetylneuraminate synthase family protein [Myxococcota bacterium]|nr:N-acetylneuraminate synthase family protein [Myxococcota bacterium]
MTTHDVGLGVDGCLVIAEVGQAHDGSLGTAHAFIDAVADAGAHAVKFQTHIAAAESTPDEPWRVKFSPQDATRYEYWRRMEFTDAQWAGLKTHADERGLIFLSSAFSFQAFELLEKLGTPAWKVASGEVSNLPLLERMIATRKPLLCSTGMSPWEELDRVAELAKGVPLTFFQCTSAYPCPPEQLGLNVLGELERRYGCAVGLSDHSGAIHAGLGAVALGADVLEVHVTLSKQAFGPDVPSSITFPELKQLVDGAAFLSRAVRSPVSKDAQAAELSEMRRLFTKSIVAARPIARGAVFTEDDLDYRKPGTGVPARRYQELMGRAARRPYDRGEQIAPEEMEPT